MNITDITNFRDAVHSFYRNILDNIIITYPLDEFGGTPDPPTGNYDNLVELQTQLQTECDNIISSYNDYIGALNTTTKGKFENALLMIVAYIGAKFGTIIDEEKYPLCAISTWINDTDGLTEWFHNYQIVLPTVDGSLNYFTFTQDGRNGVMTVESEFTSMLHTIDTTNNAADDEKIDNFMNNIANQLKQRAMYMVFNTVKVSSPSTPIVMKKFILDNLKLRQVLTDLGWSIPILGNID